MKRALSRHALEIGWKIKSALAAVRDSARFLWDPEQIVCGLSLLLASRNLGGCASSVGNWILFASKLTPATAIL